MNIEEQIEELERLLDEPEEEQDVVRIADITDKISKSLEKKSFDELKGIRDEIYELREILQDKEDIDIEPIEKLLAELVVEAQKKIDVQKVEVTNPAEPVKEITIKNVKDFPVPHRDINVNKPKWLNELKTDEVRKVLDYLKWFRTKGIETKIDNGDPKRPVAVRLSDGRKFYNAIFQAAVAGGGSSQKQSDITERVTDTTGNSTAFTKFGATSGKRNIVTDITVFNSSDTTGYVDIRDGTTGGIIWTLPLPAGGGATHSFSHALRQPSLSTALAYDVSAALSTIYISVNGSKE